MAWRVVWSGPAWNHLEDAATYIAKDSPRYAATLIGEAREAARSLRQFANRGRHVPEWNDPSLRELLVSRYRLIYRVRSDQVEILAFIHQARDLTEGVS
ncbi:MAG: type II toxin-antitoxin system RelE/ParE family toxin [Thermoanaerobaculia bacterium]|nr:type II toxin-antitoxin system RelE/ParE family toxin [Thermoanaerobaculia bacterium]